MLRVGLTGGLASGKTFAAREFARLGCPVLHADRIGRAVLREDAAARDEVVRAFGTGVLGEHGGIDRGKLASAAFGDPQQLDRLNAIVHPRVFARIEEFFDGVGKSSPSAVAIVEAAIMIETGSYRRYDRVVLAACPREFQVRRFVTRGSGTDAQAEARLSCQIPLEEKRRYAHHVIDTGGSEAQTLAQVRALYARLRNASSRGGGG